MIRGNTAKSVGAHTEVPLMLQETAGFGEPSASQIKTLCWPSSPRFLSSCLMTGAPAMGCESSDTTENEKMIYCGCILFVDVTTQPKRQRRSFIIENAFISSLS